MTEAYLAGVVLLDEYRRRRSELERRQQQLEAQAKQLEAQADRQHELAALSCSIEQFCRRVEQGLSQASFEQRRSLVELLIDRVIVTDGEVEIRYVMPTAKASEQVRFCHLRLDYRAGPPGPERPLPVHAGLQVPEIGGPVLSRARRAPQLPPPPLPPQPARPRPPPPCALPPPHRDRTGHPRSRVMRRCSASESMICTGWRES